MGVESYVATLRLIPVTDLATAASPSRPCRSSTARPRGRPKLVGHIVQRLPGNVPGATQTQFGSRGMAVRIVRSTVIDAPVATVWDLLRVDFNAHDGLAPRPSPAAG